VLSADVEIQSTPGANCRRRCGYRNE